MTAFGKPQDEMIGSLAGENDGEETEVAFAQDNSKVAAVTGKIDHARIERAVREILLAVGEDPDREGLRETPARVARMYAELFAGLHLDPRRHLKKFFTERYDEVVLVRDISFQSMCEHHMLPFLGKAHVAYLPGPRIVGLSKLARVVEEVARRPQVQERMTEQIANLLVEELQGQGRGRDHRGRTYLHDDSRRAEAGGAVHHLGHEGALPHRFLDAGRTDDLDLRRPPVGCRKGPVPCSVDRVFAGLSNRPSRHEDLYLMHELDHQRERIQEDLRGLISGDVRCDDLFCQLFSSDGSIYEIRPLGVVRPRSTADVAACVQYAAEKRISLHARGAGSGMAGESLGPGLVVDFSKYLRRIVHGSMRNRSACNRASSTSGSTPTCGRGGAFSGPIRPIRRSPPIGSMIAIDASGSRWLKYGSVRRHVESLQVVMADGQVMEFGREPIVSGAQHRQQSPQAGTDQPPFRDPGGLGRRHPQPAAQEPVESLRIQPGRRGRRELHRSGRRDGWFRGHLGPDHRGHAGHAERCRGIAAWSCCCTKAWTRPRASVPLILPWRPAACDLMDRRHLSLVRESEVRFDLLIPAEAEAAMLVEFEGDEPQEIRDQMRGLIDGVQQQARLAFGSRQAFDQEETELFLNLPNRAMPLLVSAQGPQPPGARGRGRVGPAGSSARLPGANAERAQAAAGHGIAALPRRPRAVAHPAVSRSGRSQRRAADAADGRGTLRRGVQRRRHDRRRTRLRAQPHAVPPAAGGAAV